MMGAFDGELYALGYRFKNNNQEENKEEFWRKQGFFVTYQVDGDSYYALQSTKEFTCLFEALQFFYEKEKQLKGVCVTSRGISGQIIYHKKVIYDSERFDAFHESRRQANVNQQAGGKG